MNEIGLTQYHVVPFMQLRLKINCEKSITDAWLSFQERIWNTEYLDIRPKTLSPAAEQTVHCLYK